MKPRQPSPSSNEGMGFKRQINARLPDKLHKHISDRASELDETEGGYLAAIAHWWLAQGAPPVNDYEARILAGRANAPAEGGDARA